jgi:transposase-like protein
MTVNNIRLTPVQENVIAAITGGATIKAAAEAASIHRNTVSYWRQTSLAFRDALGHAQYDKAIFIREEAECQVAEAFAAIHTILTKPDASDSARLNAAKFIIEKASSPPPPPPEVTYQLAEKSEIVHSNAQSGFEPPTDPASPEPQKPEIVHSSAQSTRPQPVRSAPKVGRNAPCPCGSRLKFKRCCFGKAHLPAAA